MRRGYTWYKNGKINKMENTELRSNKLKADNRLHVLYYTK